MQIIVVIVLTELVSVLWFNHLSPDPVNGLHERLDVCFVDHIIGIVAKLEPAAHYHAVTLAHGFLGSIKRHSGTNDNGEVSKGRLELFYLTHRSLHASTASRADHSIAAFPAKK